MSFQFPGVTINIFLLAISDELNLWNSKINLEFRGGKFTSTSLARSKRQRSLSMVPPNDVQTLALSIVLHILRDYRSITTPLKDIGNPRPCGVVRLLEF